MTAPDPAAAVPPPEPTPPEPPRVEPTSAGEPSEQLELKLPDESSAWRDLGLWAGVLVLLTLVALWPATGGKFQWLDDRAVSGNRLLALPGGLSYVWAGRWSDPVHYGTPTAAYSVYQPVAFTVDWLGYRLGGHDDGGLPTPTAYHVAALACHAAAAVLAWLALRELAVPGAWLVAAIFALHPANAEAVAWINDGGVPVGGLLFFGSIYAYLQYQRFRARDAADKAAGGSGGDPAQTWGLYATSVAAAVLAALAWPAAGMAPGVLLLALWWRRRGTKMDLALVAPVLLVTVGLWLANLGLPRPLVPGSVPPVAGLSGVRVIALVGEAVAFAVGKLLVPIRLTLFYPTSVPGGFAALVVAGAVIAGAVAWGNRAVAAAVAAVVVVAVPALNWTDPARHSQQVDPVAYLAAVPLAALVLAAVAHGVRQVRPVALAHVPSVVIASALLLVALGVGAWVHAHAFDSPVSLWQDTARKRPASAFAVAHLAEAWRLRSADDLALGDADQGNADLQTATDTAARAMALAGADDPIAAADAQRTCAAALVAQGKVAESLPHFAAATAITPASPQPGPADAPTLADYGQALLTLGDERAAIRQLDLSLQADPVYARAHRLLGQAYAKLNDHPRALREERLSMRQKPDLDTAELLAGELAIAGQLDDALSVYRGILKDQATAAARADLWQAVARVRQRQGAPDEAVAFFEQAKKIDKDLPGLDADLAVARRELARAAVTRPAMTRPSTAPAAAADEPPPSTP